MEVRDLVDLLRGVVVSQLSAEQLEHFPLGYFQILLLGRIESFRVRSEYLLNSPGKLEVFVSRRHFRISSQRGTLTTGEINTLTPLWPSASPVLSIYKH